MSNTTIIILIASSTSLVAISFISILLVKCCKYYSKNRQMQIQHTQQAQQTPHFQILQGQQIKSNDTSSEIKNYTPDNIIPYSQSIIIKPTAPPIEENISFNDQLINFNNTFVPYKTGVGGNGYYAPNYPTNYSI